MHTLTRSKTSNKFCSNQKIRKKQTDFNLTSTSHHHHHRRKAKGKAV